MQQIFTNSNEGYTEICNAITKGLSEKNIFYSHSLRKKSLLNKISHTTSTGITNNQINYIDYYTGDPVDTGIVQCSNITVFPIRPFPGTFNEEVSYDINASEFIRLSEKCFDKNCEDETFQIGTPDAYVTIWPVVMMTYNNEIRVLAILIFGKDDKLPTSERALFIINKENNHENAY